MSCRNAEGVNELIRDSMVTAETKPVQAKAAKGASEEVTIVEFSDSGVRLKTVHVPKVVKTEEEWRKQLSRGVFTFTRQADTEFAYWAARHRRT
jgi:hypothetical protein